VSGGGTRSDAKFQCGEYTVKEGWDFVEITGDNGVFLDRLRLVGSAIQDMSSGDTRKVYSSAIYSYIDVRKKDRSHERLFLVSNSDKHFKCVPAK